MAKDIKEVKTNPDVLFLTAWKDSTGTYRAFGVDSDRVTSQKLGDRARHKWQNKNEKDLTEFVTVIVSVKSLVK